MKPNETKSARDVILDQSDERIRNAKAVLEHSERGRIVLVAFRRMMIEAGASGLDSSGSYALMKLTEEAMVNGRRDFIYEIKDEGLFFDPDKRVVNKQA